MSFFLDVLPCVDNVLQDIHMKNNVLCFLMNVLLHGHPSSYMSFLMVAITVVVNRRYDLVRRLEEEELPEEEQAYILRELDRRETEYMRLQRHRDDVEDFELLTIIGRGAFGEVPRMLPRQAVEGCLS